MAEITISQVIEARPSIVVLDSNDLPPYEMGDPIGGDFVSEIVKATGALVIAIPGGRIETMTVDEAKQALQAIIDRG